MTLTVTDNDSGTGSTTRNVSPVAVRPIALVGSSANQGNVATPNTIVPAGTAAGDRLLMVLSLNDTTRTVGTPTGVTGWTLVDTATSGTMQTNVYTKVAAAADAGKTVRFAMDAAAKYTLTVAAYTGDMLAPQFAKASETVVRAGHTTPTVEAGAGDWAVSYWADKSSATTGLHPAGRGHPAAGDLRHQRRSHLQRARGLQRPECPQAPTAALTATANAASANATMWTVLLRQAG